MQDKNKSIQGSLLFVYVTRGVQTPCPLTQGARATVTGGMYYRNKQCELPNEQQFAIFRKRPKFVSNN